MSQPEFMAEQNDELGEEVHLPLDNAVVFDVSAEEIEELFYRDGVRRSVFDALEKQGFSDDRNLIMLESGDLLGERLADLERFYEEKLFTHNEAIANLESLVPELTEGDVGLNESVVLGRLPYFYTVSSRPRLRSVDEDEETDKLLEELEGIVVSNWSRKAPYLTMTRPKDLAQLALENQRMMFSGQEMLEVFSESENDEIEALRLLIMFLKTSERTLRAKKMQNEHRQAYILAQGAAVHSKRAGVVSVMPANGAEVCTPLLTIAEGLESKEDVRKFVLSLLSLVFPNKESGSKLFGFKNKEEAKNRRFVQEDMVLCNAIAITQKVGLYEEFKPVFNGLFTARQLQFYDNFHLENNPRPDRRRQTLAKVIDKFIERNGRKPNIASLGYGDTLLEKILIIEGKAERIVAVDKAEGKSGDVKTQEFYGGKLVFNSVPDGGIDFDDPEASADFRKRIVSNLKIYDEEGQELPIDIVIAADSLHETDNPRAYLCDLSKIVSPDGKIYVSDPTHCEAIDGVTRMYVNPYDSTRHLSSMLSLEEYGAVINYLMFSNISSVRQSVIPGAYAGYNDCFSRTSIVLKRFRKDDLSFREIPKKHEEEKEILSAEALFSVWPFSLIENEEQREKILVYFDEEMLGRSGAEVREEMIFRLFKKREPANFLEEEFGGEEDLYSVRRTSEDRAVFERASVAFFPANQDLVKMNLEAIKIEDYELHQRFKMAGRITILLYILRRDFEIDLFTKVRESRGWRSFS